MLKFCKRLFLVVVLFLLAFVMVSCNETPDVDPDQPEVKKTISLDASSITLKVDESKILTATYYEDGTAVSANIGFKSSDNGVATVYNNTLIGVSAGYTSVTAYLVSDTKVMTICEVTVVAADAPVEAEVKHTITLNLDGGTLVDAPTEYVEGVGLVLPTPTKEGSRFVGWFAGDKMIRKISEFETEDITLNAKWSVVEDQLPLTTSFEVTTYAEIAAKVPNKNDVTTEKYYAIGYVKEVQNKTYGNLLIENEDGETLLVYGTYDQNGLVRYDKMNLQPAVGDIIVVYGTLKNYNGTAEVVNAALVQINGYLPQEYDTSRTITYYLDGGVNPADAASEYVMGVGATLPTPTKEGYKFLGWYSGDTKVTSITKKATDNYVLLAKWEKVVVPTYTVTADLAGGELSPRLKSDATAFDSIKITKSGQVYAATVATAAYVASVPGLSKLNSLRWQPKLFLKYNESYDAYEIICVDAATANITKLGMNDVADYVIGGSSDAKVTAWAADQTLVGKFVKFSTDPAELASGSVDVTATIYNADQFILAGYIPTTIAEGEEVTLPVPVREGYWSFAGWYDGDTKVEKLVGAKDVDLVAKWDKVIINHDVKLNLAVGAIVPTGTVDGETIATIALTKYDGDYSNEASLAYLAPVENKLADGKNSLRWQFKIVLAYDETALAYKVIGVDAGTKRLDAMDCADQAEYVIASLNDEQVKELSEDTSLVGKYVVLSSDPATLESGDVEVYALVCDAVKAVSDVTSYVEGQTTTLPAAYLKGYKFLGWFNGIDRVEAILPTDKENLSLTAKFEEILIKHTISYELNGGTASDLVTEFIEGKANVTLPTPARLGYVFTGWTIDGQAVEEVSSALTHDVTVVANWIDETIAPKTYKLTLNLDGGTVEGELPTEYTKGAGLVLPTPTKDHFTFLGWYKGNYKVTEISRAQVGDLTLDAKWEQITHALTLNLDGGTLENVPTTYDEGVEYILPTPTKEHFTFVGWYEGEVKVEKIETTDTLDKVLTAKWERITHALTLDLAGGTLENAPTTYDEGIEYVLPTPTKEHFTFVGWYAGETKVEKIEATDTLDKALTAKWERITHALTLDLAGGTLENAPTTYEEGIGLTLPTPTKEWADFAGWYNGETKVEAVATTDTTDLALTAKWTEYTAKIGATMYATINAAMAAAVDNDVITLKAGEHYLTTTTEAIVTIEGPNKGVNGTATRAEEAIITVDETAHLNLANKEITFDGIELALKGNNKSMIYPKNSCEKVVFKNCVTAALSTLSGYKINSVIRTDNHTTAPIEIDFENCKFEGIDQFLVYIGHGGQADVVNIKNCYFNSQENVGGQLLRIASGSPNSKINVENSSFGGLAKGYVCRAQSGTISFDYCTFRNVGTKANYVSSADSGTYVYGKNLFLDADGKVVSSPVAPATGEALGSEEERLEGYYGTKLITFAPDGGAKVTGYTLPSTATKAGSISITKFDATYANTGTLAYLAKVDDLKAINGLRYQYKIYLKYNEMYDSYEIICVDACKASTTTLGMYGVADYVIASGSDQMIQAYSANSSLVGMMVKFSEDLSTLATGDVNLTVDVYGTAAFEPITEECPQSMKYVETFSKDLPILAKAGYVFDGWYYGDVKITDTAELLGNVTLVARYTAGSLTIDWADATVGQAYTSANWVAEQYNTDWDVITGQMNCRNKDGVKVVNFVSGYSMTRRFTYSTGTSFGIVNKLTTKLGNYFSGAQVFPIKVVLIDKSGKSTYILGSSSTFYNFPVTTGLEDVELTFTPQEVSQIRIVTKSAANASAYLYCAAINLTYEVEHLTTAVDFQTKEVKSTDYTKAWTYGLFNIHGAANNGAAWDFIKVGGKSTYVSSDPYCYIAPMYALDKDATKVSIVIGGGSSTASYNQETEKALVYVEAYSDAAMTNKLSTTDKVEAPAVAKGADAVTLTINGNFAAGTYLKIVFEITNTTTSNGVVCVRTITIE